LIPDEPQAPLDDARPQSGVDEFEVDDSPAAAMPGEASPLHARVRLLEAQLEESFARARETSERLKEEHERLLRNAAEFENFKKRAQKEKEDIQKFGSERMLRDFLPVADNLERALDHAAEHALAQVLEGVKLVQKQLDAALGKHGVTGFSAVGRLFDPNLHEALMQQESDAPPNTVISEMARGYKLNDRLIRPAAVVVAKAKAPAGSGEDPPPAQPN
jgi:molecular chaperone GrpE